MTRRAAAVCVLAACLAGCFTPAACEPENLPGRGRVERPQDVFFLAQHADRHDCSGLVYDLLSPCTQDELGSITFWAVWDRPEVAPYRELLAEGTVDELITMEDRQGLPGWQYVFVESGRESEMFLVVPAPPDELGDPPRRFRWALREQFPGLFEETRADVLAWYREHQPGAFEAPEEGD